MLEIRAKICHNRFYSDSFQSNINNRNIQSTVACVLKDIFVKPAENTLARERL
jgi:hypothetical protein